VVAEQTSPFRILGLSPAFIADLLCPKTKIWGRKFFLTVDDLTFIGHPNPLKVDYPAQQLQQQQQQQQSQQVSMSLQQQAVLGGGTSTPQTPLSASQSSDFLLPTDSSSITMFNLAFVLQTSNKRIAHELHDHVIVKWSAALKHEQLRDNFLGREAELLMALQEKHNISGSLEKDVVQQAFMPEAQQAGEGDEGGV